MSNTPSSYSSSGYASPVTVPTPTSKPSSSKAPLKPVNVFTNDGSFLERFQSSKKEEEEKKKEQEALEKKKYFENRFKNRGKRPPPESVPSSDSTSSSDDHPAKKAKPDQLVTEYEKQLKTYSSRTGLKDTGTGIRPFIK